LNNLALPTVQQPENVTLLPGRYVLFLYQALIFWVSSRAQILRRIFQTTWSVFPPRHVLLDLQPVGYLYPRLQKGSGLRLRSEILSKSESWQTASDIVEESRSWIGSARALVLLYLGALW